ncbi:MAG: FHA domain-containing protein [Gemmataceae bacterium]|nr:FHA domain-containing protein [Gemmataceae bacterium]
MSKRPTPILNQPSLIPIAGNFDRKPRTLDRDVTTIGRARGSDLSIESNEVSTLHCIIYRSPEGFRLRDCGSRTGTRVNGHSTKNALLHDGDIINLGSFSFEFRQPPALFPMDGQRLDPVKVEHWKTSRRRLAKRALRLRYQVQHAGPSPKEREYDQKANLLKDKIRCYDHRLGELEEAEDELTRERDQLEREIKAQRNRVQQIEKGLADRLADADRQIHERWQEFQQRCSAEEAKAPHEASESAARTTTNTELQAQRERLQCAEADLNREREKLANDRREFSVMKEQGVLEREKNHADIDAPRAALVQQEANLRIQKTELMRMMGDIKRMQEDLRRQAKPDVRALHEEIERLKRANNELQSQPGDTQSLRDENDHLRAQLRQLDEMRSEIGLLHDELEKTEARPQHAEEAAPSGDTHADVVLAAENEQLKCLLAKKSGLLDKLDREQPMADKSESDLGRYESELNTFRRQLESDRAKLNKEVEILCERNQELDEVVREMEMEMSKERAELARERIRLERVREEVRADMERMQRELAARDSMAPVQKLREEMMQKQAGGSSKDKALIDRLRGMRALTEK